MEEHSLIGVFTVGLSNLVTTINIALPYLRVHHSFNLERKIEREKMVHNISGQYFHMTITLVLTIQLHLFHVFLRASEALYQTMMKNKIKFH